MQNIAEIIPEVMDHVGKLDTNTVSQLEDYKFDEAWVENQRANIRLGRSDKTNGLLKIPPRFIGKNLTEYEAADDFKQQQIDVFCNKNLFLLGPCGTGKTHLSCGLLNWYAEVIDFDPDLRSWHRPRAQFISVQDFLFELKSAIGSHETECSRVKGLTQLQALVLDDFGATRLTDYTVEMLAIIINEIYLRKTSGVIITSNLSLDEIGQKIDDRTASRIVEMCEVVKLDGADRRVQAP